MKTFHDYGIEVDETCGHEEVRTTCPQCSHERHKSWDKCLAVNLVSKVWYCHHCYWKGGLGDEKSVAERVEKVFSKPHFVESKVSDKQVIEWFKGRGITVPTIAAFKIKSGLAWMHGKVDGNVNTIQFPFYYHGEVVNVKYRTGDKRFRQEKNPRKVFYNFDMAMMAGGKKLLITEGEMDCLALYEAGYSAVVSVPDGAPAPDAKTYATKFDFMTGSEELIDKYQFVILAVDNDAPGKKLEEELARRIGYDKCMTVAWPTGCKDANDVLMKFGKDTLHKCIEDAKLIPVDGVKGVDDLLPSLRDLWHKPEVPGMSIGWENAEGVFNVEPGQMTIVTGIPSHGKSTFIDALRVNLYKVYGCRSAVFSPENWPAQNHLSVLVQMFTGHNFYALSEDELTTATWALDGAFWFIQPESDDEMMTVDAILQRARALVYRQGVQVLVIDPWNEIEHDIPAGQREDQYISIQLAKIRRFARVNGVHVFIIAHPRQLEKDKDGNYPPPTAYDIAGGAMWRNKADNILCVYRPSLATSEAQLIVQKIRFRRNGKAGVTLSFKYNVPSSNYYENGVVSGL